MKRNGLYIIATVALAHRLCNGRFSIIYDIYIARLHACMAGSIDAGHGLLIIVTVYITETQIKLHSYIYLM